jgi:vancomycin resistance protein YoaR
VAKGFVAAPVIGENGYFSDDVGGGVSQFATTMFNAAFFAGLEIPEYQAHGIYISRYPYGREATLDYGNIDLKVRNNTPFGILLWPTYTDSSITVSIYSTRYIEAGQDSQTQETSGAVCTRVTTVRKRTWVTTGEVQLDKFTALYTPAEGMQCDGTMLPNPAAPPTTTPASGAPPAAPPPGTPTTATTALPAPPASTTPSAPPR